jgi:hypothetical protein
MSLRPVVRRSLLAVAALLLIVVAFMALAGGLQQIPRSRTLGQRVGTTVQLACGLLSVLSLLTVFRRRRWGRPVLTTWALSLATTAGLSSLVWGPPSPIVGLVFAAAALLVALGTIRLLQLAVAA